MLTCPDEWITGKRTMTPDEAVAAGVLDPSQVKGNREAAAGLLAARQGVPAAETAGGPFSASRPVGRPAAARQTASGSARPATAAWRRAEMRLLRLGR